jgi:DNA-binding transcriptional MerR regulator
MYTIGELSKIVKISIDALRYYDEIGLLKPYHIDTSNRYRYYSAEQVNEIIIIMEWKQYGYNAGST